MNIVDVRGDELFLLGGAEAYKNGICAACGIDRIYDLLRVLEVAVMRAGKHESRKFRTQVCAGLFCDTRFGTEQKETHVFLGHRRTELFCKFNARNTAWQALAENFCGVDNADAVRQHKGSVIYDAHELRVTAAEINDFRVRRYNITLLPRGACSSPVQRPAFL